jgi:hypothetical protein
MRRPGSGRSSGIEVLRKKVGGKAEEGHPQRIGRDSPLWERHNGGGCHATCTLVQGVLQYDGLGTCGLAEWDLQYEERSPAIPADFIDDLNKRKTL